jgi:hypothetical protein
MMESIIEFNYYVKQEELSRSRELSGKGVMRRLLVQKPA